MLEVSESLLVASLVLLLFGWQTRFTTVLVLVTGLFLEALYANRDLEHATVFLTFLIPLLMSISGRWGSTYSVDSMLRKRITGFKIRDDNSSGIYFLPARALLILLSVLFMSAALWKLMPSATWLWHERLIANLMLQKSLSAVTMGLSPNPFAPYVSESSVLHNSLRYGLFFLEGLFFLGIFNRHLRSFFISSALLFHAFSALFMVVTFTPILIIYPLFIDWQSLRRRLLPRKMSFLDRIPSGLLVGFPIVMAVLVSTQWNSTALMRSLFNFGGLLNWQTIWYPILPLAIIGCGVASIRGLLQLVAAIHSRW
ncbi:hypothetical protein KFU94_40340 [Chloroflexi bacterium TSY]|nr:hypothetical protein [Chloroflexi bacterium TSY]